MEDLEGNGWFAVPDRRRPQRHRSDWTVGTRSLGFNPEDAPAPHDEDGRAHFCRDHPAENIDDGPCRHCPNAPAPIDGTF